MIKQDLNPSYQTKQSSQDIMNKLTVKNGRVYVMKNADDTSYSKMLEMGDTYKVPNYALIKLAALKDNKQGSFQYWTLNGMIYSYDRTIFFSSWCDADFEAVYAKKEITVKPTAFISDNVHEFGFETADKNLHKITFHCAFYIPVGVEFISTGIIFSPSKENIEDSDFCNSLRNLINKSASNDSSINSGGKSAV